MHLSYAYTLSDATINELAKLLPTASTDPRYNAKIDHAARFLRAHYPVRKWWDTMLLVPVGKTESPLEVAVRQDVLHRASVFADDERRTWRTVGIIGAGLTTLSIGVTVWSMIRRSC
jgi:hypothetical protein